MLIVALIPAAILTRLFPERSHNSVLEIVFVNNLGSIIEQKWKALRVLYANRLKVYIRDILNLFSRMGKKNYELSLNYTREKVPNFRHFFV